jgi:superfamily II DNA/RNA helicase
LQVHREFVKLAPSTLNCVAVYGGADPGKQAQQLRDTVDVVIG